MPLFINKISNAIVLANYKVMYSTLRFQKNLVRTGDNNVFKYFWRQRLVGKRPEVLLIVRNPYFRLISFFEDKLANPRFAYDPVSNSFTKEWQVNQKIMFPYLGISDQDDEEIKEILSNTSFRNFVMNVLPNIYLKDGHLRPQYLKQYLQVEKFGIKFTYKLKPTEIMPIENLDKVALLEKWGIDARPKENSTKKNKSLQDYYDRDTFELVNKLYKIDFDQFGYQIHNK